MSDYKYLNVKSFNTNPYDHDEESVTRSLKNALLSAKMILNAAIDANVKAKEQHRQAKLAYEAQEASVLNTAHATTMGKNADSRKAEIEHILWSEREADGELHTAWIDLQATLTESIKREAELEKAKNEFTYQQILAKLQYPLP